MPNPRIVVSIVSVAVMALSAGAESGQSYPNKPIRIVTGEPGGVGDLVARLLAQGLAGALGQPAIVENRRGTLVAAEIVAKAIPDGYTLIATGSSHWIGPLIQQTPYDPVKDFSPISVTTSSPNVLVVHPSVPVNSVMELITLAKARPGILNYASGQTGSSTHLAPELFKAMAGVDIVRIPYKGAAQALNDVIAGQVQLMFSPVATVTPHMKSGRLKALAVTSVRPSSLVPGLATVAASGVPGFEAVAMTTVLAPAKTPGTIIKRLNHEIVLVLNKTDVKEKILSAGAETVGNTPEQFAATMKTEMTRMGKVIKDAGIRGE